MSSTAETTSSRRSVTYVCPICQSAMSDAISWQEHLTHRHSATIARRFAELLRTPSVMALFRATSQPSQNPPTSPTGSDQS